MHGRVLPRGRPRRDRRHDRSVAVLAPFQGVRHDAATGVGRERRRACCPPSLTGTRRNHWSAPGYATEAGACRDGPQVLVPALGSDVDTFLTTSRRPVGCPGPSDDRDAREWPCRHPPDATVPRRIRRGPEFDPVILPEARFDHAEELQKSLGWREDADNRRRCRPPHRPPDAIRLRVRGQLRRRRPGDADTRSHAVFSDPDGSRVLQETAERLPVFDAARR